MNVIALLAMAAADLNGQPLPDVVLLDFTAGYCQPCQQMAPLLQRMESDGFPIRKIDITEQPDVSRQYRVDRIPTLIVLVEGQEVKRFVGLRSESELRREMNDAARKLDRKRRTAGAPPAERTQTAAADPASPKPAAAPAEKPGLLDRMRDGLFGRIATREDAEQPDFRGQSPEDTPANGFRPMNATVRVRLDDGKFRDVGTGTIIHSAVGQSTILTCAHIFKDVSSNVSIVVDVFRNGEIAEYPAKILGGDHNSDISIIQIQNKTILPVASLSQQLSPSKTAVFSIGCNNGARPTMVNTSVVEVNRYEGPENIVCAIDPVQGRSGGGLFSADGSLIGVCSGAFRQSNEGLYTGVGAVRKLLGQLNLNGLFKETEAPLGGDTQPAAIAGETPNPFAEAEDSFAELFGKDVFSDDMSEPDGDLFAEASPFTQEDMAPPVGAASLGDRPDPFAPKPRMTSTASASSTEITVIIGSSDSAEKRVVVIPQPSPWLMQLLTGESADQSGLATTRSSGISTTSARTSAQPGRTRSRH